MYGKTRLPETNSISSMTRFSVGAAIATNTRSSRTRTGKSLCRFASSRGTIARSERRMQTWFRSMPGTPLCSDSALSAATSEIAPDSVSRVASGEAPFAGSESARSSSSWLTARCLSRMRPSGFFASSVIDPSNLRALRRPVPAARVRPSCGREAPRLEATERGRRGQLGRRGSPSRPRPTPPRTPRSARRRWPPAPRARADRKGGGCAR